MNDESLVEKENLNFEEKSSSLDVYGLNWILIDFIGDLIFKSIWVLIGRNLSSGTKIFFLGIF